LRNIVAEMAVPPTFFFEGLAGALAGGASQNRS
jgi:hypothetical protein